MNRFLLLLMMSWSLLLADTLPRKSVKKFVLSGKTIEPGSNVTVDIELPRLYSTPTKLSVRVIRGKLDGPTVFITAAIHGDELNGIEIIRRFRNLKILNQLKGTLLLIPIVNVYGVMNRSRYLPDRRDLNRYFPGSEQGSLASRIAKIIFEEVLSKSDLGIDLHTASHHRSNFPQIRTNLDNKYTMKLAKAFEAPVILHSEVRDGSLRAVGQESGVPILLYEAGEALRFDEKSIRIGVEGIVKVLQAQGMLPKYRNQKKAKNPVISRNSEWLRASDSGIIRTIKGLGDTVKEQEIIAYIYEPLEDKNYPVKAMFDGVIVGKSEIPLVQEGDALFHVARFRDLSRAEKKIEYFYESQFNEDDLYEFNDSEAIE